MDILVTGGAGYVGSIVAEELLNEEYEVTIIDNLQQGHIEAILPHASFTIGDICDIKILEALFEQHKFDAVMHMAAETVVEYSVTDPRRYFQNNVAGGINILNAMLQNNVRKIIFSSSAAVYGEPQSTLIKEDHPKRPVNAYGESKLMFERILEWYSKAYELEYISLRYFNAAGATTLLGEDHNPETHLIPNILKSAMSGSGSVSIFGTDYPTKDGSCIRDYVHVVDIARAHVLALHKLESLNGGVYNLGNGEGYSVFDVVKAVEKVTKCDVLIEYCPRRAGDPAVLVASNELAKRELGWEPRYTNLESIIESAWKWLKEHPNGYTR